jgi:hypothetical protein
MNYTILSEIIKVYPDKVPSKYWLAAVVVCGMWCPEMPPL